MDMTPEEILRHHFNRIVKGYSYDNVVSVPGYIQEVLSASLSAMREYGEKQSPRELLERTWDAAVAITHWEERNAEWSKCTLPDKETFINSILGESPKEEAVEFAEWAASLYRKIDKDDEGNQWVENLLGRYYTSEELYTLFKQTK